MYTYEECSYPDISQFTGELTDFLLFLLPRFPFRSHLVIAHSKEKEIERKLTAMRNDSACSAEDRNVGNNFGA